MTKAKPVEVTPSLPEWVLHSIIGVLFAGLMAIGIYVWNNSASELGMLDDRVTRTNDRQVELDRRLTVLETEFRIHQGTGK